MRTLNLQELHEELLKIAHSFHSICQKESIPYYMLGGTMLGAIRHKGFIPWDDDMDFGVPREYFKRLAETLKRNLPPNMKVLDIHNSNLFTDVLKIEMTNTKVEENGLIDKGINIDIFPLDYTNNRKDVFSANFWIYLSVKYNCYAYSPHLYGGIKGRFQHLFRMFHPIKKDFFPCWIEKISLCRKEQCTSYANHFGFWNLREIVDKNYFGKPILYKFEGVELYGVADYDKYLISLYGNYMELPPAEKRHIHLANIWMED